MDPDKGGCMTDQAGRPYEMRIEPGKVREFARATKSASPGYFSGSGPAPVTFLMSYLHWTGPEHGPWGDSPPNYQRLLHGEQEFVFPGPMPEIGEELIGQARIDRRYVKQGSRGGEMTFIEIVYSYTRPGSDTVVAEVRSTLIETSKAAGS
jgi:N-terminal half of MaoC dehydratase